jgi:hypothetical protein
MSVSCFLPTISGSSSLLLSLVLNFSFLSLSFSYFWLLAYLSAGWVRQTRLRLACALSKGGKAFQMAFPFFLIIFPVPFCGRPVAFSGQGESRAL